MKFEEFYQEAVIDLHSSKKKLILPWIYWPRGARDSLRDKRIIAPSAELFLQLDDKVQTKKLFNRLGP